MLTPPPLDHEAHPRLRESLPDGAALEIRVSLTDDHDISIPYGGVGSDVHDKPAATLLRFSGHGSVGCGIIASLVASRAGGRGSGAGVDEGLRDCRRSRSRRRWSRAGAGEVG
jgi:hypothetical protein